MKIIAFGVRDYEKETFHKLEEKYNHEFVFRPEYLNDDNVSLALGYEAVMVRGNCFVTHDNMKLLKDNGLKYYLTRTAGYNHVDIAACKEFGIKTAYVPGYSPASVAELSVALAMSLLRNTQYTGDLSGRNLNFKVTNQMFSKEIRECTVGIIGCGKIGYTAAKDYKGLGARVLAFDLYPNPKCEDTVEFVDLDTLLKESDIISCHMAYFPGKNDRYISKEKVDLIKEGSIVVNVARAEVLDNEAVVERVEDGSLSGFATDVIDGAIEKKVFGHEFASIKDIPSPLVQRMVKLYPKVIVTPHVGSATVGALKDMVEISLQNLDEFINTGTSKNSLIKE